MCIAYEGAGPMRVRIVPDNDPKPSAPPPEAPPEAPAESLVIDTGNGQEDVPLDWDEQ
jgi:hypothetical protein